MDPADTYSDLNNNGQWDSAEYFEDRSYDFYDENDEWIYIRNGKWDDAEPLMIMMVTDDGIMPKISMIIIIMD